MTCEDARLQLDDYVDSALDEGARRRVAAHLDGCAACAGRAADLARLRDAARALGPVAPPEHLWRDLARRIGQDAAPMAPAAAPPAARRSAGGWLGVAAAVVVLAAGVYVFVRMSPNPPAAVATSGAGNAGAEDSVKTIEQDLQQADRLYSDAIAGLEALATADAGRLDPQVAASLRQSQAVLDRAIAESRTAVDRDPANEAARSSLFQALRLKVRLLQDTIALVGEMRDATPAGPPSPAGPKPS